jgi:hypothetical protein
MIIGLDRDKALGAKRTEVLQTALGRPLKLLAIGSAAGLFFGILASRVLAFIVYQGDSPRSAGPGLRGSGHAAVGAGGYVDSSPTRSVGQSFDPAARGVSRGSLLSCLTTGFSAQWPFHMTRKPRSAFSVDAKSPRHSSRHRTRPYLVGVGFCLQPQNPQIL